VGFDVTVTVGPEELDGDGAAIRVGDGDGAAESIAVAWIVGVELAATVGTTLTVVMPVPTAVWGLAAGVEAPAAKPRPKENGWMAIAIVVAAASDIHSAGARTRTVLSCGQGCAHHSC
jgi:hypothetical protein